MLKAIILIGGPSKGMWNFDIKCKLRILVMTTWQMAKTWYYRHPVVLVSVASHNPPNRLRLIIQLIGIQLIT